jgi:hypothetical protein
MEKLRFKHDSTVFVMGNDDFAAQLHGYDYTTKLGRTSSISQVLIFAKDKKSLETQAEKLLGRLADNSVFWIAYPKKTGAIKSDITRDNGWDKVMSAGYAPVTQIALDDNWSALRFKRSGEIKTMIRDIPMSERQTEGIDYVNRTVKLPTDASKALKEAGLLQFFEAMSFSHKKEYAESIADAKKEETRKRRIEKMVDMIYQLKEKKKK